MAQVLLDLFYSFGNCLNCFPGNPNLKINNRSFKILRLLGEIPQATNFSHLKRSDVLLALNRYSRPCVKLMPIGSFLTFQPSYPLSTIPSQPSAAPTRRQKPFMSFCHTISAVICRT
ncbi:hypothetical protein LB505_009046 [Fusarium chuoi]|nr:hypothetical protein LB505_009046 [Fusarium chuoi]